MFDTIKQIDKAFEQQKQDTHFQDIFNKETDNGSSESASLHDLQSEARGNGYKSDYIPGEIYGSARFIKNLGAIMNDGRIYYEIECIFCKKNYKMPKGSKGIRWAYLPCKCLELESYGGVKSWYLRSRLADAIRTKHVWRITGKIAGQQFLFQKGLCYRTGLPLHFGKKGDGKTTASLDRIDSSQGYLPGNICWVHQKINISKMDYTWEECADMWSRATLIEADKNHVIADRVVEWLRDKHPELLK